VHVTLFHNPKAGDADTSAEQLRSILKDAGYQVRYQSTKKDWRSALDDPGDMAIVAGGDGTVAKVAEAFAGSGVNVAVLPFGTANNIGKALGVFGDVRSIVEGWHAAPVIEMDVGVVSGPFGERRFLEAVGGGVFAELVGRGHAELGDSTVMVGRETDRALQLCRRILEEAEERPWQVALDDYDMSGDYLAVEAMNIGFAGPNIPLATDANLSDGELDLVLIRGEDRERLLEYVISRVENGSALMPSLDVRRGAHLRITPPAGWPIRIDDELIDLVEAASPSDDRRSSVVDVLIRPRAIRMLAASPGPRSA